MLLQPIDRSCPQHLNLVDWVNPALSNKRMLEMVMDKRIEGQYSSKAMMLAAQLCSKCIELDPKNHPSMKQVVEALEQIYAIKETLEATTSSNSSESTSSYGSQQQTPCVPSQLYYGVQGGERNF